MLDLSSFQTMAASLQAVREIGKALIDARDESVVKAKVAELNAKVLETQALAFQFSAIYTTAHERAAAAEKRCMELEDWARERERYALTDIRPSPHGGLYVYALKPSMAGAQPPHSLCATCYQRGLPSILQARQQARTTYLVCGTCKGELVASGPDLSRQRYAET